MVQTDAFDIFVGECLVRMNFTDLTTLHRQKTHLMVGIFSVWFVYFMLLLTILCGVVDGSESGQSSD